MSSRMTSKMKSKRSVKSNNIKQEEYDTSILRKPFSTSITGLAKALKLFQTTTDEIREYLSNEIDILYECRVCRSIFRSVSNLILHKRSYCQEKFSFIVHSKWANGANNEEDYLNIVQKEPQSEEKNENKKECEQKPVKKNINSVVESLAQRKHFGFEVENFSISDFYDKINNKPQNEENKISKKVETVLNLDCIEGSTSGVFQTISPFQTAAKEEIKENKIEAMKQEVMEIHNLLEGQSAVLGPDGKVININLKPKPIITGLDENTTILTCEECNIDFSTRKTLNSHIKYKHKIARLVYPCLECSDTFSTPWSVYRHLFNIHRKTLPQVRKMRAQIQAKAYEKIETTRNNADSAKTNESLDKQQKKDEENQAWMDNFDDMQMCGGCGRRFERRAALNSHSQMCQKRIAAQNIINVNKLKRSAAAEEKIPERKGAKIPKLDDNKNSDDKKIPQQKEKKRKIGIQIRYDYTKTDKNNSSSIDERKENEDKNEDKTEDKINASQSSHSSGFGSQDIDSTSNIISNSINKLLQPQESIIHSSPTPIQVTPDIDMIYSIVGVNPIKQNDVIGNNDRYTGNIVDPEIVSIPSTTPDKDDPLCLRDLQSDTDSEIEEILGPDFDQKIDQNIDKNVDKIIDKNIVEIKSEENSEDCKPFDSHLNVNESTMKLLTLFNSEPIKHKTLDEKMTSHVNMKRLQCINCKIKFSNISKLRSHMSLHFNWFRFRCDICAFNAYDKLTVYDHIKNDHNIQDWEKIEAVIFQIPEWETLEMSSNDFLSVQENEKEKVETIEIIPDTLNNSEEIKNSEEIGSSTPDNCFLITSNKNTKTYKGPKRPITMKKVKTAKTLKIKKKIEEVIDVDMNNSDPLSESGCELTDSSECDRPVSAVSSNSSVSQSTQNTQNGQSPQEYALKKMVYEVIFGETTATQKSQTPQNSATPSPEKEGIDSNSCKIISRPVRNRVKPIDKDFIYDLHEFKEQPRTVFNSNNSHNFSQTSIQISESLEELNSNKNVNKFGKNLPECDTSNESLNFTESVTLVESKNLNFDKNVSPSDSEDDVYIVENNQLFPV